jgi:hypothetical protein
LLGASQNGTFLHDATARRARSRRGRADRVRCVAGRTARRDIRSVGRSLPALDHSGSHTHPAMPDPTTSARSPSVPATAAASTSSTAPGATTTAASGAGSAATACAAFATFLNRLITLGPHDVVQLIPDIAPIAKAAHSAAQASEAYRQLSDDTDDLAAYVGSSTFPTKGNILGAPIVAMQNDCS